MTRTITALIGFVLLAGCSGGGGDSSTPTSAPVPLAQPDMLTATPQGILRGKANGQGQQEILQAPNLLGSNLFVDQGNIVYSRTSNAGDIWTVRTDGTGDHALLNSPNLEFFYNASWPWVIFEDDGVGTKSLNAETQAQFPIGWGGIPFRVRFKDARVIFSDDGYIYSETFTGTDRIVYVAPDQPEQNITSAIVEDRLVYRRLLFSPSSNLFSVPILGGTTLPLDSGQSYVSFGESLGARVVYARCPFVSGLRTGPCDVVSVNSDGSAPVVLASDPANEAVQGVTTNQVIIRRNLAGNDQLVAVPVAGGPEKLLMSMTDNEFVDLIVGDLIIVRRPSGTWSLDLNGTLTKLGTVVGDSGFIAVGNSVCVTKVTAVWCMPLDGSGPQVKIANNGKVVGVL
ncbi:MAG: hypothetical protein E8D41_16385 [Nitrospira sp.]|nr:MAG: hypothetical protein E8D41_16385 [Nitrospira sp.]